MEFEVPLLPGDLRAVHTHGGGGSGRRSALGERVLLVRASSGGVPPPRPRPLPLSLVTPDLSFSNLHRPRLSPPPDKTPPPTTRKPFEPTGFITAFSTWTLEPSPIYALSSVSFSGHLAELGSALDSTPSPSPSTVLVNHRACLQIIDVASIHALDRNIFDHAFQLCRDCSSATCLRNRSVKALAAAAFVQDIREAQEPRTLQEISTAGNLPQKEIGKYIKMHGEVLKLSQPINSNYVSVYMPRVCTFLQLNKTA